MYDDGEIDPLSEGVVAFYHEDQSVVGGNVSHAQIRMGLDTDDR